MDSVRGPALLFGVLLVLVSGAWTDDNKCKESDACHCVLTNGTVNLESLASTTSSPKFRAPYNISAWVTYNPCKAFNGEDQCHEAAACLQEEGRYSDVIYTSIFGKQGDIKWNSSTEIIYTYEHRYFVVTLVCRLGDNSSLEIVDVSGYTINAVLTSKCACPGECPLVDPSPAAPDKHFLSTGSIVLILFFSLVVVYLVGGIIYNKVVNGATGTELIPNVEFWSNLPRLVLDGVAFTCNCCAKRKSATGYDNV